MTVGQTYEFAWTGAVGAVEVYAKKNLSLSSWRAHLYGGGQYLGSLTYSITDWGRIRHILQMDV